MRWVLMVAPVLVLAGCTATPTAAPTPEPPCVAGTWQGEPGEFSDFIEAVLTSPSINAPLSAEADGEVFLTFTPEGRYSYRPSASFQTEWPFGAEEGTLSGESTGTWFENDGTLLTQADKPDYPGVSLRESIGGGEMHEVTGFDLGRVPILSTDIACDGDAMTATFGAGSVVMPLNFVRAT